MDNQLQSLELGMPMDLSLFDWVVSIEKKKDKTGFESNLSFDCYLEPRFKYEI